MNIGKTCECKEWLLNVTYRLKNREGLLPAGYAVAKDQLVLNPYKAPAMDLKNVEVVNTPTIAPQIQENDWRYLIINGDNFRLEFNKHTGYLNRYNVAGTELMNEDAELAPNFWRAPTDNDFGAGLRNRNSLPGRQQSFREHSILSLSDFIGSDPRTDVLWMEVIIGIGINENHKNTYFPPRARGR